MNDYLSYDEWLGEASLHQNMDEAIRDGLDHSRLDPRDADPKTRSLRRLVKLYAVIIRGYK